VAKREMRGESRVGFRIAIHSEVEFDKDDVPSAITKECRPEEE
jgi:hypothetical protein